MDFQGRVSAIKLWGTYLLAGGYTLDVQAPGVRLQRTQFRRLLWNEGCDVVDLQNRKIEMVPWIPLCQKTIHERYHIAD